MLTNDRYLACELTAANTEKEKTMNANVWKNAFYKILTAVIGYFVGIGLDFLFGASQRHFFGRAVCGFCTGHGHWIDC